MKKIVDVINWNLYTDEQLDKMEKSSNYFQVRIAGSLIDFSRVIQAENSFDATCQAMDLFKEKYGNDIPKNGLNIYCSIV